MFLTSNEIQNQQLSVKFYPKANYPSNFPLNPSNFISLYSIQFYFYYKNNCFIIKNYFSLGSMALTYLGYNQANLSSLTTNQSQIRTTKYQKCNIFRNATSHRPKSSQQQKRKQRKNKTQQQCNISPTQIKPAAEKKTADKQNPTAWEKRILLQTVGRKITCWTQVDGKWMSMARIPTFFDDSIVPHSSHQIL